MDTITRGILLDARRLVAEGWVQDCAADDGKGETVTPWDARACRFCITGALYRAVWEWESQNFLERSKEVEELLRQQLPAPYLDLPQYNDAPGRTQAQMLALFDRALEED